MKIEPWKYQERSYARGLTVPQLFEAQVEAHPESTAVVFKDTRLTYAELNNKANQLARYLQNQGVGPEKAVLVSMDRSYEVYIALMATQKAGGAYVAIEPLSPESRLKFYVEDSNPIVILTLSALKGKFSDFKKQIFCLDSDWELIRYERQENIPLNIDEDNLSDIIYTSGSTGLPKGVLSMHRNRINALFAWEEIYGLSSKDVLFQTTSLGFDVFTADYTRSLCLGSTIVPSEENFTMIQNASVERMYELLINEGVTFAEFNVTTIRKLFSYVKANKKPLDFLRIIVVGADAWYLTEDTGLSNYCKGKTRIINAYGMTEEAVDSLYFERTMLKDPLKPELSGKSIIGIPFPNTKVYLLDKELNPVEKGKIGTMYFGGLNTARGYLNREELTQQRFVVNPFEQYPNEKIYNSGDLARIIEENVLEFLGRIDFQVEINSKRVEPTEVEAAIQAYPLIKEVVVIGIKRENLDTLLVAYLATHDNSNVKIESLKDFLRNTLPDYMIPSVFVILETLPLNTNGKVDRKSLPLPDFSSLCN